MLVIVIVIGLRIDIMDVSPLANDLEAGLLQRRDCRARLTPGIFGISNCYFGSLNLDTKTLFDFGLSSQILGYRVFDICQRLLARLSLGVTAGEIVAPNSKAFVGFDEGDAIVHGQMILLI